MKKILLIFGTRPEAIKMCPLILELKRRRDLDCVVCLTGQHKEMLQQVMDTFNIKEDYNLNIMKEQQTVYSITTDVLCGLQSILENEKPDIVLVHGDTTTSFAAALAAFYQKIPVAHVEAGLRTGDKYSPYPEEMNRCLISRIAEIHFAPTKNNSINLANEGITKNVFVTGNTVIDSFRYTIDNTYKFKCDILNKIDYYKKKIILLTVHRRENWGDSIKNIFFAVKKIIEDNRNVEFIYPVHLNPKIRMLAEETFRDTNGIYLVPPLSVKDMHNLMFNCYMVMTDSGGLQEEAPALGKPVLVLRNETERPEAVEAGTAKVVGTDYNNIIYNTKCLLENKDNIYNIMSKAVNPYGNGKSSEVIADILLRYLNLNC